MLQRKELYSVTWITAENQLANPLTKAGASSSQLIDTLKGARKLF